MRIRRKNEIIKKIASENQAVAVANRVPAGLVAWAFKILFGAIILSCTFFVNHIAAQRLPQNMPFNHGEVVNYDVFFKWGIIMPRAGHAQISFDRSMYKGQAGLKYQLLFRTTKFFDAIYKMRDTLECFYDQNYSLLYTSKRVNEGGYYLIDDLTFSYAGNNAVIRSHRYTPSTTKIDTFLTVSSGYVSDMLGAMFFLRTLGRNNVRIGESYSSTVVIGRHMVKIRFRYRGQSIVEREDAKYKTHYFLIDIFDEAFEQSEAAAELWVSDDDNYIPIKIRTKLKIGYAEVYYKNSSNLKVPLTSRIEMK